METTIYILPTTRKDDVLDQIRSLYSGLLPPVLPPCPYDRSRLGRDTYAIMGGRSTPIVMLQGVSVLLLRVLLMPGYFWCLRVPLTLPCPLVVQFQNIASLLVLRLVRPRYVFLFKVECLSFR